MTSASSVHSGIFPARSALADDRPGTLASPGAIAEVAVTLPVPGRYHYLVPETLAARARIGARVLVRFGNRKVTGVVVPTTARPPAGVKLVPLSDVLDDQPSLSTELVDLCLWVADYYEAPPGEAIKAALPAGSGIGARRGYVVTDAGRSAGALPPKQQELLARLGSAPIPATGLNEPTRRNLEALRERGLVEEIEQRDAARARLKRERIATLVAGLDFDGTRADLAAAPRKLAAFEAIVAAGGTLPVSLLNKQTPKVVAQLVKAGVVTIEDREQALAAAQIGADMHVSAPPELTSEQAVAVDEITAAMVASEGRKPFLLHGVTGSGKTEVYLRVIARALELGKTALVLVPEISLTPQLAARFRARFGDKVAILHSGLTEQARLGEWSRLHRGEAVIAVGARSAVFAPLGKIGVIVVDEEHDGSVKRDESPRDHGRDVGRVGAERGAAGGVRVARGEAATAVGARSAGSATLEKIGVIVVDEEHDGSFKQDESPRYHGRDVALVRAQRAGAVCVLGSATPSLESHAHATRGQYR